MTIAMKMTINDFIETQAYKDYALMHNYTVIIRKVMINRRHIQRLCIVTN